MQRRATFSCLITVIFAIYALFPLSSGAMPAPTAIDAYFSSYATTNNLSGSVLITRGENVLFSKSYGLADRANNTPNQPETRFHIASVSILFTSTAVLRLIDQGKLSFDTHVSDIVERVPNGEKITIRELLEQNSGLPDVNDFPNYDKLLAAHQTPESLVAQIQGLQPFAAPGGKSLREEHSGQNLLALIIERKTGLPFAQAMKMLVFDPFGLHDTGVDDDSPISGPVAQGQQLSGTFGLKPAPAIHWSAKPGNGSAYTTIFDEWKWLREVLHDDVLSKSSREAMFGASGYGWDQSPSLGGTVYVSSGRAPGFSSVVEYVPNEDIVIIALTNIENAANPTIVRNTAAMLLGKPYQAFSYKRVAPTLSGYPANFVFGPNFYRPSATLRVVSNGDGVTLDWPGGPSAPLLPIARDQFIDRYYWAKVTVVRGKNGEPVELDYGKFKGTIVAGRGR